MSMPPKITVLIPTFNRNEYLKECLDSILSQTLGASQIIVINDGSTDNTKEILTPYMRKIEYLETQQLGKSSAINVGLKHVRGDYLWIFDDDDVALPDALERHVAVLEGFSQHAFSYGTHYLTDCDPKTGRIGNVIVEQEIPDLKTRGMLIPLLEKNYLGGAGMFVRTSCYQEVGPFAPELYRSQDYEMAIRIVRRFTGIRVSGNATFYYRQHEGERGHLSERFKADDRIKIWLKYNQIIFRRLYGDLPLEEYLPPGGSLAQNLRQALLQRMAVMSFKLLITEVTKDLCALAKVEDQTPITEDEYMIIRTMITSVYYQRAGSIYDNLEFFDEVHRLCAGSAVMCMLRKKIVRAIFARLRKRPGLGKLLSTLNRIFHLYY